MDADPRDIRIRELEQENAGLRARVEELERVLRGAAERVEAVEREAHRSAAPFRRDPAARKPPGEHGTPGRRPGHEASYRVVPPMIDEVVSVPLACCPVCGGPVHRVRPCVQHIEEIPEVRARVTRLTTYTACCPRCGTVRGTHPLRVSVARGSAGTHLGPRALSLAAWLNKGLGLTLGASVKVLGRLGGLSITRGGLTRALERVAGKAAPLAEDLARGLRAQGAVNADETGWWLGGSQAWLWVFATPERTVYRIDRARARQVVEGVLGPDFAGVLVSDCLAAYERLPYRTHKCYAHHLRALAQARERAQERGRQRLDEVAGLLKMVLLLTKARRSIPPPVLERGVANLRARFDALLDPAGPDGPTEKVLHRLRKRKVSLLTCLEVAGVDPTNNLAERQLRPAVIARKLSHGHKSRRGADAWQTLASLAATAAQRGQTLTDLLLPCLTLSPR